MGSLPNKPKVRLSKAWASSGRKIFFRRFEPFRRVVPILVENSFFQPFLLRRDAQFAGRRRPRRRRGLKSAV
jgi:hypothetical protein